MKILAAAVIVAFGGITHGGSPTQGPVRCFSGYLLTSMNGTTTTSRIIYPTLTQAETTETQILTNASPTVSVTIDANRTFCIG